MPITPKNSRVSNTAVPLLRLPAIFALAMFGLGGSLFLAYTTSEYKFNDQVTGVVGYGFAQRAPFYCCERCVGGRKDL